MSLTITANENKNISTAVILTDGNGKRMNSGIFPKSLKPVELINCLSNHFLQLQKLEQKKLLYQYIKKTKFLKNS